MLEMLGWRVLTVWECELKHPERLRKLLKTIETESAICRIAD